MKFHSWWDLQTPQFKASVASAEDVRAGYVAGYSYGHSDCRERMAQLERENKELRAKVAELEYVVERYGAITVRTLRQIIESTIKPSQPKEGETVQAEPNQTIEHPCVITDEACGLCMTGEGECLEESKSHPNTLAGFLGRCAGDQVTPTQQMIFDAGVSSGMQRQKASQPTKCVEFIQHQVIGGTTFNALSSGAQDWIMGACEKYDNKTAQASLEQKEGE